MARVRPETKMLLDQFVKQSEPLEVCAEVKAGVQVRECRGGDWELEIS